jgi:hypothetical protein
VRVSVRFENALHETINGVMKRRQSNLLDWLERPKLRLPPDEVIFDGFRAGGARVVERQTGISGQNLLSCYRRDAEHHEEDDGQQANRSATRWGTRGGLRHGEGRWVAEVPSLGTDEAGGRVSWPPVRRRLLAVS